MGLQNARVLVAPKGGYEKLWKTVNPPMATPISSVSPLLLDSLVVTGEKQMSGDRSQPSTIFATHTCTSVFLLVATASKPELVTVAREIGS